MYYDIWAEQNKEFLKKLGFKPIEIDIGIISAKTIHEFKKAIRKKQKKEFIILKKPSKKVLKTAIKRCNIDATDRFVKYPLIKKMSEKNMAVIINFRELIVSKDIEKTLYLMTRTVKLAKKYKTPLIVTSGAKNKWELRSASDLIGFCEVLGLTKGDAKKTLFEHQKKILDRIKLKKTGKWISPGVRVR